MITEVRQTWQFFRDRRPDLYGELVNALSDGECMFLHSPENSPRTFAEIHPPFEAREALVEANAASIASMRLAPSLALPTSTCPLSSRRSPAETPRIRYHHPEREYPRAELRARLSGGRIVRRRVRHAPLQPAAPSRLGACSATPWTVFIDSAGAWPSPR